MQPSTGYLSEADPRYRCCCDSMHVRLGAIVIGILEIVGSLYNVGHRVLENVQGEEVIPGTIYIAIVGAVITIIVVIIMFVGISKQKAELILPHLVLQVVGIIGLITALILYIVLVITDRSSGGYYWYVFVIVIIVFIVCAALEVWFFIIILKLYRYYKEMASLGVAYPNALNVQPMAYAPPPDPNVQQSPPA